MTRYEKIDRCDNKLKSRKRTVNGFTLFFFKNFFLVYSESSIFKLSGVKF